MKTVSDYAPYAEAVDLLARMQEKHDSLVAEQHSLLEKLRFKEASPVTVASNIDRARAIIDGNEPPPNRGGVYEQLRDRELDVRQRLEVIATALRDQPSKVEMERIRARREAYRARAKDLADIRAKWDAAQKQLKAAIDAEDAFIVDLLTAGFGQDGPSITNPDWLDRDHAIVSLAKAAG